MVREPVAGTMLLAAEVDGGRFRLAQFTRFARDAVVEADVEPYAGRLRLGLDIHGAPGRLAGLLTLLEEDGAIVEGPADDALGRFAGTCDLELPTVEDGIVVHLAALRQHAHSVRLRIRRGRIGIIADVREGDVEAWRKRLGALDHNWTLLRPGDGPRQGGNGDGRGGLTTFK